MVVRDRPATVIGICLEVEIPDMLRVVQRVDRCAKELVDGCKWPALGPHSRGNHRHRFEYMLVLYKLRHGNPSRISFSRPFNFLTIKVLVAQAKKERL